MKFFRPNQKIDVVDLGELRAFMFKGEFYYEQCLKPRVKNYPLFQHYEVVEKHGYQDCPWSVSTIDECRDSQYCLHTYLTHMHRRGKNVVFLDIGAYVGAVSLCLANFARTSRIQFKAIAFDPSLAGTLVPFNIDLNGLGDFIEHQEMAISPYDGPVMFSHCAAHMDSTSLNSRDADCEFLVPGMKISSFLKRRGLDASNLLVKIDTEGFETPIIADLISACKVPPSFVFEFCPTEMKSKGLSCEDVLATLHREFVLFSVPHVPKPYRVERIEPDRIKTVVEDIDRVGCGFTDIWAIPRTTKDLPALVKQLDLMDETAKVTVRD